MNIITRIIQIYWAWLLLAIIGVALVVLDVFCPGKMKGTLLSLGLSIIASVVCGAMVDCASRLARRNRARKMKEVYFAEIRKELRALLGNLLWYAERLPDKSFDWSRPPESYWKVTQLVMFQGRWPWRDLAHEELDRVVAELQTKFSLDSMKKLPQGEYDKVVSLFEIVMFAAVDLMKCCVDLHQQRLTLAYEDILSLEDSKGLIWDIKSAWEVLETARGITRRNLGFAIGNFARALKTVESDETTGKPIKIGLSCPFWMTMVSRHPSA